ncbi:cyclin-A1 [Scleropages formosus]|uniref:Cyclin A1 n=1 Tax=Scleropages formosus TaxID=113540 RepID=A0A8C9R3P9_SCLFO|nr:cyclin-A1 [Scleropages formosus]
MSYGNLIPAASFGQEKEAPQEIPGPGSESDTSRLQAASRVNPRTALGVLTENLLHNGRARATVLPVVLHSKPKPASENVFPSSHMITVPNKFSSPGLSISGEDGTEISLSASGGMVADYHLEEDMTALRHKDFRLFLDLSSSSCKDTSMQSQPDDPVGSHDIFAVDEYSEDIYIYLRRSEVKHRPKPGYMLRQPDITNCMRVILVDWLVEVGQEYNLSAETLYLAVNYLDRFLSCMSVLRGKLQLVGTAAMIIAAKYEEIYPPDTEDFAYVTDNSYTKKQLLQMEQLLLKVLAFDLAVPTAHQFLKQFLTVESVCSRTENLALYLAELSLLEVDPFLRYSPSKVAAAAYCLGNYTMNRMIWPVSLHDFTGYTLAEIAPCLKDLYKMYWSASSRPQQAIQEKYKASKYCSVSLVPPPASIPFR